MVSLMVENLQTVASPQVILGDVTRCDIIIVIIVIHMMHMWIEFEWLCANIIMTSLAQTHRSEWFGEFVEARFSAFGLFMTACFGLHVRSFLITPNAITPSIEIVYPGFRFVQFCLQSRSSRIDASCHAVCFSNWELQRFSLSFPITPSAMRWIQQLEILLMEELPNNKPCKWGGIYHIGWCRISSINSITTTFKTTLLQGDPPKTPRIRVMNLNIY